MTKTTRYHHQRHRRLVTSCSPLSLLPRSFFFLRPSSLLAAELLWPQFIVSAAELRRSARPVVLGHGHLSGELFRGAVADGAHRSCTFTHPLLWGGGLLMTCNDIAQHIAYDNPVRVVLNEGRQQTSAMAVKNVLTGLLNGVSNRLGGMHAEHCTLLLRPYLLRLSVHLSVSVALLSLPSSLSLALRVRPPGSSH